MVKIGVSCERGERRKMWKVGWCEGIERGRKRTGWVGEREREGEAEYSTVGMNGVVSWLVGNAV